MYIDDICDDLVNNIRLFADHTSLYPVVENGTTSVALSLTSDLVDIWSKNGQLISIQIKLSMLTLVKTKLNSISPY